MRENNISDRSGRWDANENIDELLMQRHVTKKVRRSMHKNHLKVRMRSGGSQPCSDRSGSAVPAKRTAEDDTRFAES